jgi:hypothetical protein
MKLQEKPTKSFLVRQIGATRVAQSRQRICHIHESAALPAPAVRPLLLPRRYRRHPIFAGPLLADRRAERRRGTTSVEDGVHQDVVNDLRGDLDE